MLSRWKKKTINFVHSFLHSFTYSKSCIRSLPRYVFDIVSGTQDIEMRTIQFLLMGLTVHTGYETLRIQKSCFLNLKHPFRLVFHCLWRKCNLFGSSIGQETLVCVSQRWHIKNFHWGKRWSVSSRWSLCWMFYLTLCPWVSHFWKTNSYVKTITPPLRLSQPTPILLQHIQQPNLLIQIHTLSVYD